MAIEFTRCRHAETGGEAEIPTDAVEGMLGRGWEPISGSRSYSDAQQELAEAQAALLDESTDQPPAEQPELPGTTPQTRSGKSRKSTAAPAGAAGDTAEENEPWPT